MHRYSSKSKQLSRRTLLRRSVGGVAGFLMLSSFRSSSGRDMLSAATPQVTINSSTVANRPRESTRPSAMKAMTEDATIVDKIPRLKRVSSRSDHFAGRHREVVNYVLIGGHQLQSRSDVMADTYVDLIAAEAVRYLEESKADVVAIRAWSAEDKISEESFNIAEALYSRDGHGWGGGATSEEQIFFFIDRVDDGSALVRLIIVPEYGQFAGQHVVLIERVYDDGYPTFVSALNRPTNQVN